MSEITNKPTLLTLPRELRDLIYEYTFADSKVVLENRSPTGRNAGILCTCKQIYAEARKPYYQNSIFTATDGEAQISILIILLDPHVREWITSIRCVHSEPLFIREKRAFLGNTQKFFREDLGWNVPDGVMKSVLITENGETVLYDPKE